MAVNKVIYNGQALIDLTGDTVTPETLAEGVTAHNAAGEPITGTMAAGGGDSGEGDPNLPSGHRRADYILFTGEQIIDSGIICNKNTKIQLAFTREKSTQHYLYGVASSGNTESVTAYLGGSWRFGNKSATKTTATNANMIYSGVVDDSTITVTGSASAISSVNEFETIGTLLIGTCRSSGGEVGNPQFAGKIFFFTIWQGDEQIVKLIPVTDGSGAYRFWDIIGRKFHDSITDVALEGGNL